MKIELKTMNQSEYESFMARSIPEYAKEKQKAEGLSDQAALELAQKTFSELLPYGLQTEDHHLYCFTLKDQSVGELWLAKRGDGCFIYELYLDESLRGQGLGKQLMALIDSEAKSLGFKVIRLHVFGHNKIATKLYQSCGYEITNLNMAKKL
ncbi:MAG: GNAT family N-acetyltransferase [Halobacteriovorax sp.]|nr:GNAT family N-acetyltransferase [Halobacteriovorax sp.]